MARANIVVKYAGAAEGDWQWITSMEMPLGEGTQMITSNGYQPTELEARRAAETWAKGYAEAVRGNSPVTQYSVDTDEVKAYKKYET